MSLLFQLFTYLYASGGGFSNYFATPDYQKTAVANYLENNPISYNKSLYNSTGTSRGFPDLSANGANYVVSVSITITIRRTNSYGSFLLYRSMENSSWYMELRHRHPLSVPS